MDETLILKKYNPRAGMYAECLPSEGPRKHEHLDCLPVWPASQSVGMACMHGWTQGYMGWQHTCGWYISPSLMRTAQAVQQPMRHA